FTDRTTLAVGTVVWATGYRSDYSWIGIPGVARDGTVIHRRGRHGGAGLVFPGPVVAAHARLGAARLRPRRRRPSRQPHHHHSTGRCPARAPAGGVTRLARHAETGERAGAGDRAGGENRRPASRSGHLELEQARLQARAVHGVVAGQGVDPQHVVRVQQDRGDRRREPGHGDIRTETAYRDVVIARRRHHPELIRAVVRRRGIGRRAEVRREVDHAGPGQVVHRDVVPEAALVVAAEAEPGHVLDVDAVGPVPAVVPGDQVARVGGQAEGFGLERAAQLQRVLPGAAVHDVVPRGEGRVEDVERAHELVVAAAERDPFRADAAVAAGDDVVAGAGRDRD